MQREIRQKDSAAEDTAADLWSVFLSARTRDEFFPAWLALQSYLISDVLQGVIVANTPGTDKFSAVSGWPAMGKKPERLADISERVLSERCGLVARLDPTDETTASFSYAAAFPVTVDGVLLGAAALEVKVGSESRLKHVMEQLQWGISWLEIIFRRERMAEDKEKLARLGSAMDLMAVVLAEDNFDAASMALVTELAGRMECERVSIGFMSGRRIKIKAVSFTAGFKKKMNLVRCITGAMEESVFMHREIIYPVPEEALHPPVTRNHEALASEHGAGNIMSIPCYGKSWYYGALVFERPAGQMFDQEDVAYCRSVASLVFPVLHERKRNDRFLLRIIFDSLITQSGRLIGSGYPVRKLIVLLLIGLAVFFCEAEGNYYLSAKTSLEGEVVRVVAAPFDGYVKEAQVRAGDTIGYQKLLCALDDRDLRLERLSCLSRRAQLRCQKQEALVQRNRSEVNTLAARIEQAEARLELVEGQLKRTRLVAPFDGLIVSGDLSRRLGGFVEEGEVLFEITPLDSYRVILKVDERRIRDTRAGQTGSLVLTSLPNHKFEFRIEKITPVSIAEDGRNYFHVEARLKEVSDKMRPGMEGIGKIFVDHRRLALIWSRDLIEWFRLFIWKWWP